MIYFDFIIVAKQNTPIPQPEIIAHDSTPINPVEKQNVLAIIEAEDIILVNSEDTVFINVSTADDTSFFRVSTDKPRKSTNSATIFSLGLAIPRSHFETAYIETPQCEAISPCVSPFDFLFSNISFPMFSSIINSFKLCLIIL